MTLTVANITAIVLIVLAVVKVLTYFHDRTALQQIRRDLRLSVILLRIFAIEPDEHRRRERMLDAIQREDLPED